MLDQSSRTSWCQELQADIFVFPCCRGIVTYPCELSCMAVPKDYNLVPTNLKLRFGISGKTDGQGLWVTQRGRSVSDKSHMRD